MLYLQCATRNAVPKNISERTSYNQVWLAFHPYPQVIPWFCNISGFGPPRSVTSASPCPWIAHLVSGLLHATIRPIQTRFRFDYGLSLILPHTYNSLAHSSKGRQSGINSLLLLVSYWFQVLFHSPHRGSFHLSLTVLVHYRSLVVLSLTRWSSRIHKEYPPWYSGYLLWDIVF